MVQVVNAENLAQLATTGSVPEFKAPEAAKPEAKPDQAANANADAAKGGEAKPAGGEAKADAAKDEPARDANGQFVKADDAKKDDAGKPAKSDDDDEADLPERVRKQIGKKHRLMMEATEFARERDAAAERERVRADTAERELQRLRGGKSDGPKAGEGDAVDPEEPKQADFKTVGEYSRALIKYEAKKAADAGRKQANQRQQQEQANALTSAFAERQEAFMKATPDYEEVVGAADIEMPPATMQYLVESEVGPQLGYYLAQNPEEISRLRKLSPSRQLAELGKLEIKVEKPAAPVKADAGAAKEISKAPAPIAPLKGETTPVQKDPSQMSVSELREFRRQEALAKAGR